MALTQRDPTTHADGRVGRRIENYSAFWQKDLSKEGAADSENRLDSYADVVNGEYSFIYFSFKPFSMAYMRCDVGLSSSCVATFQESQPLTCCSHCYAHAYFS